MNKFNELINNNLGIPTQMAIMLYKSLVRTIIESSYMCWCTINESSLQKLDSIQGIMLKMRMRMRGQVSYEALNVEAAILPIKLRLKQILTQYGCKIIQKDENSYLKSTMLKNLNRRNIGKYVTPADKIRMSLNTYKHRNLDISNLENEPKTDISARSLYYN